MCIRDKSRYVVTSQFNIGNNPSNEIYIHLPVLYTGGGECPGPVVLGGLSPGGWSPEDSARRRISGGECPVSLDVKTQQKNPFASCSFVCCSSNNITRTNEDIYLTQHRFILRFSVGLTVSLSTHFYPRDYVTFGYLPSPARCLLYTSPSPRD